MAVELTLHTFLDALSEIGCHTPHPVFAGGARYVPPAAARRARAAALDELAAAGLTEGSRLKAEFEDLLHVLDRPHTEYFAYVRVKEEQYASLVAARGRSVVVAIRNGSRVRIDTTTSRSLADVLVDALPPEKFPSFDPFTVHSRQLREEPEDLDGEDLHELLSHPEHGLGYLHVARRPDGHNRLEADNPVCYLDVELGRVGLLRTDEVITVFPGSPEELASRVAQLRATLD